MYTVDFPFECILLCRSLSTVARAYTDALADVRSDWLRSTVARAHAFTDWSHQTNDNQALSVANSRSNCHLGDQLQLRTPDPETQMWGIQVVPLVRKIPTLSCTSLHQISLQTHNAKPIHSWKDQPLFRPYVGWRASDAKGMNMHLECRWSNQPNQESTHRSSGDTMGTGSFQTRFPSWPSEAGDRLRSNVVSHNRLRSNVVSEKQVSASSMSLSHNVDTDPSKMNVCSCTYLYLDVFVHKKLKSILTCWSSFVASSCGQLRSRETHSKINSPTIFFSW
jgi:hypothetical protein